MRRRPGLALSTAIATASLAGAASTAAFVESAPGHGHTARPNTVRFNVSVSGDLLMHLPLIDRARQNAGGGGYDFTPFFRRIRPYVSGADLALCHLETPMGPGAPSGYPLFNTPPALARSIDRSGWDACSTASNHSLDQGVKGIAGTSRALDRAGVEHTGSFRSKREARAATILRVRGVKLGYLAYTDATNGLRAPTGWALNEYEAAAPVRGANEILRDARRLRDRGADAVIVNVHWGDEYAASPNSSQRRVAKRLARANVVAAIVGQGPHVVQPIQWVKGKPVVFSEGNLVSNQSPAAGLPPATQDGVVALLRFEQRRANVRVKSVKYVPTWVRPGDYVVLPADPDADRSHASELRRSRARTIRVVGRDGPTRPLGD